MLSYLVPYLFEKKFRPKIERTGSKVTSIKLCNGVTFRDVTKMLTPSTNLRSFGQMFNLDCEKSYFPFSILTSVKDLSIESLPTKPSMWKSDLSQSKPIGRTEIAEAVRLWRKSNCKNLGDYLATYLRLDVEVLYRATQEWRKLLKKMVSVDFIESGKYTISSLSNLAGGKDLIDRRRIGYFFPNNSQHYRLLREGMRGQVNQEFSI